MDDSSVALLQSLAPYHSIKDMAVIVAGMEERRLFPLITESSARDRICHHISSIKGLIPSLYTLFESLKYLEPCSYALRALLPGKVKGTIRQELFACYRPTSTVVVQMQEMQYNQVSATTEAGRELAYWQLWLFAMRHFPDLTSTLPRKDKGRPKPLARPINVLVCRKFAGFAVRLGFVNPITRAYQNIDAERHLTDSIDNVSFTTYLNDVNHSAAMIAKGLAGNLAGLASSALPRLTGNAHVPIQQRVGRPFESSFEEDRDYLFLPYLACEARSDLYITTFFATTNLFSTFFGVDDENVKFRLFQCTIEGMLTTGCDIRLLSQKLRDTTTLRHDIITSRHEMELSTNDKKTSMQVPSPSMSTTQSFGQTLSRCRVSEILLLNASLLTMNPWTLNS